MLEIIKYQLKGRKNAILLMLAIFSAVNLAACLFEAKGLLTREFTFSPTLGFWIPVAVSVTVIATIVLFFLCSSGHVNELLYKNTSYLMLTVPRHGWEILGGRFIAGLIEFFALVIPAFIFMTLHLALGGALASGGQTSFAAMLLFIYRHLFVINFIPSIQMLLLFLCVFATTGIFLTFAAVASRSFIRNKGLGIAITIAVFITVSNWATSLGTHLSMRLGWFIKISMKFQDSLPGGMPMTMIPMAPVMNDISVPVAPFLCFLLIAMILFAAASWLMEKKVEL